MHKPITFQTQSFKRSFGWFFLLEIVSILLSGGVVVAMKKLNLSEGSAIQLQHIAVVLLIIVSHVTGQIALALWFRGFSDARFILASSISLIVALGMFSAENMLSHTVFAVFFAAGGLIVGARAVYEIYLLLADRPKKT